MYKWSCIHKFIESFCLLSVRKCQPYTSIICFKRQFYPLFCFEHFNGLLGHFVNKWYHDANNDSLNEPAQTFHCSPKKTCNATGPSRWDICLIPHQNYGIERFLFSPPQKQAYELSKSVLVHQHRLAYVVLVNKWHEKVPMPGSN